MSTLRRWAAYALLVTVYGCTWVLAVLGGLIPRRSWKPNGRIMVTGTFHNPNWYLSHITPLARSGVKEVILVVDEPQLPLEKVRFVCPPKWIAKVLGRAGAKALWVFVSGLHYRPDLYMGYHIVPAGCSALIAGRLLHRPSCYQVTGAPLGPEGGFPETVGKNGSLMRQSRLLEAMALRVVRKFDHVVVRGNKTKAYLISHGLRSPIDIITGSVNGRPQSRRQDRDIHLIYVGQLAPIKRVDRFIAVVQAVTRVIPSVKAVIVGSGPLMTELQRYAGELGLTKELEFLGQRNEVEAFLARSRVFVLTSESEGLSIAMAEAMVAGAVPVVPHVGELGDLVVNDTNGYLVEPENISDYSARIISLLQSPAKWNQLSCRAAEDARRYCGTEIVTEKWRELLHPHLTRVSDDIREVVK